MRLPAVRLPSLRLSFEWLEGWGGRPTLLYALYTLVLFLICMVANFPAHPLVLRVIRSLDLEKQGMRLEVGDTRFAWWHGYELQRVRLTPTDPDRLPFAEAASVFVRPGLDGLVRGQITSLHAVGSLYGGELDGEFTTSDGLRRATLAIDRVDLKRYPLASTVLQEGVVAGVLSGAITIESHGGDINDLRAAGELDLDKASITDAKYSSFSIPELHFDKADMKFSLQGGHLDLQELEASGPDLKLSLNGQIALREPIGDSVLNLKLTAVPGPNSPDLVKTLLAAFVPPAAKGAKQDAARVISGTLARPRLR